MKLGQFLLKLKMICDIWKTLFGIYLQVWPLVDIFDLVGYGDYYAVTNLGRLVSIISTIFGAILISLIIIALQSALTLSHTETRV